MIKISELDRLAKKVNPKATVRYANFIQSRSKTRNLAHVHVAKDKHRGDIYFTWTGLNRSNPDLINTLAHELAHLRVPKERHDSPLFKYWTRQFQLDLVREVMKK